MATRMLTEKDILLELCTIDDVEGAKAGYAIEYDHITRLIDNKSVYYTTADLILPIDEFSRMVLRPLIETPRDPKPMLTLPPEQVRGSTHGNYTRMATTAQNIKIAMRAGDEGRAAWGRLRPVQTESLELIATKLARIMCGDSCCEDHWRDIAGYATLVADRIKSGELK